MQVSGTAAVRVEAQQQDDIRVWLPSSRRFPRRLPLVVRVERSPRQLDLLAVIFLVDMIFIWSFPDGSPAFLSALDIIAWIVGVLRGGLRGAVSVVRWGG